MYQKTQFLQGFQHIWASVSSVISNLNPLINTPGTRIANLWPKSCKNDPKCHQIGFQLGPQIHPKSIKISPGAPCWPVGCPWIPQARQNGGPRCQNGAKIVQNDAQMGPQISKLPPRVPKKLSKRSPKPSQGTSTPNFAKN